MVKQFLFKLLQPLLNESGKGGGDGTQVTKTEQTPLTPAEAELNRMQIERARIEAERAKALSPYRETAQAENIRLLQQRIATQRAGEGALRQSLADTPLSQQRDDLRTQIIQDALDKVKGKKSYVSEGEKGRLGDLTTAFKTSGTQGLTGLGTELQRRGEESYRSEGRVSGGFAERVGGRELTRQIGKTGRAAGMQGAQMLMQLPQQNRLNMARQLETSQRQGQQARFGRQQVMGRAAGLSGYGDAGVGTAQSTAGGDSLSRTLAAMEQARQQAAIQTSIGPAPDRPGQALQGGAAGAVAGAKVTGGNPYGAIIGGVIGLLYGYNA